MATYYVQISSAWQGDRFHTCYKTDDPGLAEFLAGGLHISENQFGERNPGLSGMRDARAISKTQLQRQDGVPAVRMADEDSDLGFWDDAPARSWNDADDIPNGAEVRHVRGRTMITYQHHTPRAIADDVRNLLDAWKAEKAEQAKAGRVDFLIRDMPGDLHAQIKSHALEHAVPMNQAIIEILQKSFQK